MNNLIDILKKKVKQNQLAFFISGALILATTFVSISLWIYQEGGAAQLDLSRPSYQEARKQARKEAQEEAKKQKKSSEFIVEGDLTRKKIEDFEKIFTDRIKRIEGDFFDSKTLSDETLNLTEPTPESEQ